MNQDSRHNNPAIVIVIILAFVFLLVAGVAVVTIVGLYSSNRSARDHAIRLQMENIIMQKEFAESRQEPLQEQIEMNEKKATAEITFAPTAPEVTSEVTSEPTLIEIDVDESGILRIDNRAIDIASLRERDVNSQQPKVLIHVDKLTGTEDVKSLLDYFSEIEIADIEVTLKE